VTQCVPVLAHVRRDVLCFLSLRMRKTVMSSRTCRLQLLHCDSSVSIWAQGAFETWLLLEYADRGALDKAVSAGRFRRKSDGTPELVWVTSLRCQQHRKWSMA